MTYHGIVPSIPPNDQTNWMLRENAARALAEADSASERLMPLITAHYLHSNSTPYNLLQPGETYS